MAESEEALQLKRRARRRLVGAVALVTFIVIILPLLLDKEPGPAGPPLDVQIPRQETGGSSRIGPPAASLTEKKADASPATAEPPAANVESPAKKSEPPAVKSEMPAAKSEASAAKAEPSKAAAPAKPAPAAAEKAAVAPVQTPDKSEQERAQAALQDESWVIALDAFSDVKNVKQLQTKLSAAGVKSYTEPVKTSKGELTRVRAGPFPSKEAAEKARTELQAMGLKPGAVASR
ncbi:MAG: SPOR domain-containing protein [Proteobacteria bacterium]|nr:SPOR domain-containing protein [Pseudomonadota bacterium]